MISDFLELNRLFVNNIVNQLTGGQEAMKEFLPRQELKMRTYFLLINFWQQMSEELAGDSFNPKSLEEGGRVYGRFQHFEEQATGIFDRFETNVDYSEEGLFERWFDGMGKLVNRAVLGSRGALFREMEYEFERFWNAFFQLVRKPSPLQTLNNQNIIEEMISIRASNFTKLKEFGLNPPFIDVAEADRATLALKQKMNKKYIEPDPTISASAAEDSAESIVLRMMPEVMIEAATMFANSLNGETLMKIFEVAGKTTSGENLEQVILQELDIEMRYVLQLGIGLSRILYKSLIHNETVKQWVEQDLKLDEEATKILNEGLTLQEIALQDGPPEGFLVNTDSNQLPDLKYTSFDPLAPDPEKGWARYEAALKKLTPLREIKRMPALLEAANFAYSLVEKMPNSVAIITKHFSHFDEQLPGTGDNDLVAAVFSALGAPLGLTINNLLKKIAFKPLWAKDEAWLERSVSFMVMQVRTLHSVLAKLEVTLLDDDKPNATDLLAEVADHLCMAYAYRSVSRRERDIQTILTGRLREQLYGRVASQLRDTHTWVAKSAAMNLKILLMVDLSSLQIGETNVGKNDITINFPITLDEVFPEWGQLMDENFVEPLEKKLALLYDLQLGNEFTDYKSLEQFNYLVDYDRSTLRGVLGNFLQTVSGILQQSYTLRS